MKKVYVKIKKKDLNYQIYLATNTKNNLLGILSQHLKNRQIVVLTDNNVYILYARAFIDKLIANGYMVLPIIVKPGERSKSYICKQFVETQMQKANFNMNSTLIVYGGGVVGDLGGFVAATYMRGISYVNVPTTFLAMVDSSIGGKTAINSKFGKNMLGAYWFPQFVYIDINYITSLSKKEYHSGLIESVKIFIVNDKFAFDFFNNNIESILTQNKIIVAKLVYMSIKNKNSIVQIDNNDTNIRNILNYGHTVGHALEVISRHKLLHGYAVGLGIIVESKISLDLGLLSLTDFHIILNTLRLLGIEISKLKKYPIRAIIERCLLDKKYTGSGLPFILIKTIGKVYARDNDVVTNIDINQVENSYNSLINYK